MSDLIDRQVQPEERTDKRTETHACDLISRQAAIDAIHGDADWLASQGSDWQVERMERDKSILQSLPSAQPERKTGKWSVEFSPDYMGGAYCECSQCNCKFAMGAYFEPDEWKFCPDCGADMRGDE